MVELSMPKQTFLVRLSKLFKFRAGYSKAFLWLNRPFNFFFALFFLLLSMPMFIVIGLIVKLQDGGPIFYKGVRLGKNKKPYMMYKFRSLVPDAETKVGAQLVSPKLKLETKFGKFLRDTRIDELPQLINVLKGEMDFIGPRPERPLIYEKICRHIKGYDRRFAVNPGLIGYSQLFTPHSTPKEIRAFIDNHFLDMSQNLIFEIGLMFYTMMIVLQKLATKTPKLIFRFVSGKSPQDDKRVSDRIEHEKTTVLIEGADNQGAIEGELVNINHEAFLFKTDKQIRMDNHLFELFTEYRTKATRRVKKKTAVCGGEIFREIKSAEKDGGYFYIIKYKPVSPLNFYMIHQYFLQESIVL
ncbi:MAG: sugar transferase [Nitrospirae bacterium]|nr:sugar transferase [Nitrospirota bacterium]